MPTRLLFSLLLAALSAGPAMAQIGITRHNHLALQVADLQASKKFYGETLGLAPIEVPDDLKAIRGWFSIGNGQQIHLLAGRTIPVSNDRNGSHFAVFVASMDKAEAFLKQKNIKYHLQTRFDGVRQIYIADPDGYLVELNEEPKPKP